MRILYTPTFDKETTKHIIMFNEEMDVWLLRREGEFFYYKYLGHSHCFYHIDTASYPISIIMSWFRSLTLKCYAITEKDYNIIDEILTRFGYKKNIIQRIKDSLVETKTIF